MSLISTWAEGIGIGFRPDRGRTAMCRRDGEQLGREQVRLARE